jgi:Rhomboid-like protein
MSGILGVVRRLPVTIGFLSALLATGAVLVQLDPGTRRRAVLAASTNLDNLEAGDVSTLLTSAFVVGGVPPLRWWAGLAGLLAGVELLWGSRRIVAVFLAGHVGATVLVAIGLAVGVRDGWVAPEVAHAVDVGVSYGVMALVGGVVVGLPRLCGVLWAAGWLAVCAFAVAAYRNFTCAGHLCALLIGVGTALVALCRGRPRPADPFAFALVAAGIMTNMPIGL